MSTHSPVLRYIALASGIAGTLFWIYTFYWISKVPPGDGTGFQWIAEVPLTADLYLPDVSSPRSLRYRQEQIGWPQYWVF